MTCVSTKRPALHGMDEHLNNTGESNPLPNNELHSHLRIILETFVCNYKQAME